MPHIISETKTYVKNRGKNGLFLLVLWPDASLSSHHSFQALFALEFSLDLQRNLQLHSHMTALWIELNLIRFMI